MRKFYSIAIANQPYKRLYYTLFFFIFSLGLVSAQQEFPIGSADTIFTCSGFFTDTGGANNAYGSNENLTTTICSDTSIMGSGSHIKLLFRDVNIFRDHPLCFFDGTDPNAPLIACAEDFSADLSSNVVDIDETFPFAVQASVENTSGCITVSFNSGTNVRSGWVAEISCIPACQKIVAKISASDPEIMPMDTGWIDACPGQQITLSALSDAGVFPQEGLFYNHRDSSEYIWDMGDGKIRYGTAINHTYEQSGGYIIQLKIRDQLGCTNANVVNQRVRISTKPSFNSALDMVRTGCSGDTITLNAAVNAVNDSSVVSVLPNEGTFLAQRIRSDSLPLPDGTGEIYTTSVTFSNFATGQTLQNEDDILGICLNIEHSWLRDLEISIACPNGQSAILHDHPDRNGASRTLLGVPVRNDDPVIPGEGFDYCWKNNAPNPTWIQYVRDNMVETLPSGDYNAFEPLSNLIGCPLNGEWSITVKDLWAQDNGFIFSWGIEFDPTLFPDLETFTPNIVSYRWEDDPTIIQQTDESITAIPDKSGEAAYIFSITDDFGCVWDTSIAINILPPTNIDCYNCQDFRKELRDTMLCAGESVELSAGPSYTETVVSFETSPRYTELGFPNHPLGDEYQSTIEVTDVYPGIITDPAIDIISVCVDIETGETDWVSDLTLSLISPDGAMLILSQNNGGGGSNYTNTCFTPTATVPIRSGDAPFTGDFMPEESWNNLIGQPMNGAWILEVSDNNVPQLGTFHSWSITFNSRNGITYTWSPANGLSCNDCPNPSAQPDSPQLYQVSMEDVFGCTYDSQVDVGSVADFAMPMVNCGVTDPSKRQITFDWTAVDDDGVDYEVRIDGGSWVQPNNGTLSHTVEGLRVSQTVMLEVRPYIPNAPDNCDIPIAQSQCTYNVCTFNISAPDAPTPVSCVGIADGVLNYNLTEGTAPYSFSLNGEELINNSDTTGMLTDLPAGMLAIIVTDADNCADTLNIEVASPDSIAIDATVIDALCRDGSDGSIELMLSGGTGTLTPNWSTGATTDGINSLIAGTYEVSILDENNCQLDKSFVVSEPDSILIESNVTNISCAGENNGVITLSASGGTGVLTYNWNTGENTPQVEDLEAGIYRVSVTDENGCLRTEAIEIESPAALVIDEIIPIDVDCNGSNSGSAIVRASGGTMPYEYLWSDDLGQIADTAKLLTVGNYEVTVTDASGCQATEVVTITEPEALSLEFFATAVTCFDGMDGTSTAIVTGGISPYSYQWNDVDNQTSQIADSLAVGTYTLMVTDANNCTVAKEVEIGQPANPISATFEQTFTSCFGENDGVLEVIAEGGSGINYTYLWSNGQAGSEANNLSTETYTVTITDQNMCSQTFESPKIEEHPEFVINMNFDIPTCNGFEDGTAGATVREGGTGSGYQFKWNTGEEGFLLRNIQGGTTYSITVTDDQGCQGTESRPLPQPDQIIIALESTDVICFGEGSGSASITEVSGGNMGYSFLWNTGANTRAIDSLSTGTYSVTVTDTLGCLGFASIDVTQPTALETSFDVKDNSCFDGADGRITASIKGGIPTYQLLWSTDEKTSTINSLTSGTYVLTVTDNNGCESITPVNVEQPEPIDIEVEPGEITCAGGRDGDFTVMASGGTNPYTYSLDNKSFTSNTTFLGLSAGNYDVYVKDRNGCIQVTDTDLFDPPPFEVFIFPQEDFVEIEFGNEIQLFANANNNSGIVEYVWTTSYPDSTLTCTECADPFVNPEATIYYELYGIDEAGCEATDRIQIRVAKFRKTRVPTGFTPNGDLLNDKLMVHGTADTKVLTFQVFDRWGELLYEARDFDVNDESIGWDGNFRSKEMPVGVYVWFAEVEYLDGMKEVLKGSTQLIRN